MDDNQKSKWTLRRFTSLDAMKAEEYDYWQSRPVHERLTAASELSVDGYRLKGTFPRESGLRGSLSHLNAEGAKYLIVGGYAVAIHAQPRATKDLDIFIGTDPVNGEAVWRALKKFGAPVTKLSPDELAEPDTFFTWGNPPFRVDILTCIPGIEFGDAWTRKLMHIVNEATGLIASFICAEDLITNKQISGQKGNRLQDLADVAAIQEAAKARDKE